MFLIINKFLIPKGYRGLTIFPLVFLKYNFDKSDKTLINHEKIHIRQQLELLLVLFYVLYVLHFLINIIKYKNHEQAYRNIIFEKEAYAAESDFEYLGRRKPWGFINFW